MWAATIPVSVPTVRRTERAGRPRRLEGALRPAHVPAADHFDLRHGRRVQREGALHADAVAELAHGVGLVQTAALAGDDVALEDLDALLAALDDAHVHLDLVAGREVGDVVAQRLVVDDVGGFHGGTWIVLVGEQCGPVIRASRPVKDTGRRGTLPTARPRPDAIRRAARRDRVACATRHA